jgi:predicted CopG family antitoxin
MAKFSITIDDTVAKEIENEKKEGESVANTIERLVVTAIGRLAASRKWSKKNAKAPKAKKAKAPKGKPSAAKKAPAKKAKAPKAAPVEPQPGLSAADLTTL